MSRATPRTRHGIFVLLRRLRLPLTVLIIVYAVAVAGFTLIQGLDPQGRPWAMSFLQAFYFVSFLGTTIGLGEIPYPFTDSQRLWATATIYATVLSWLYAIGGLFSVLQDPVFRRILRENSVERAVHRLRAPFYLVCGYDDAGSRVVRELVEDGTHVVVIEALSDRVDAIDVEELAVAIPALSGDASDPQTMLRAGLTSNHCVGVLALTGEDGINTKVALTARLLNPGLLVLCAVRAHEGHARMAAAGADYIINPYDTFAERMAFSIRAPSLHVIYESLTTQRGTAMDDPPQLPRGRWILCGFGLFARTLRRQLGRLEIETTIVDSELDDSCDASNSVRGDPTDPDVLERAGIATASAIIAGTAVDIDNLAITLAARARNKRLFIVARQTQRRNSAVFRAAPADLVMLSGYVIAAEVLRVIRAPLLASFLRRARDQDEMWAAALLGHMRDAIGDQIVESWTVEVSPLHAPTVCAALDRDDDVSLLRLMSYGDYGGGLLHAVPLLLHRGQEWILLPQKDTVLQTGDRMLFCGRASARAAMRGNIVAHALPAAGCAADPGDAANA